MGVKHFIYISLILFCASAFAQPADTQLHVSMKPVQVKAKRQWENDTVRYHYNQTKYYITTILPYLNEAVAMHNELQARLAEGDMSRREKKQFLKEKEDAFRQKFDAEIKELNETQGTLLVKLVARQTGENIYGMLQEYKNTIAAAKWLVWARVHGFNLNKEYNPDEEPMLENIMVSLDYPLPDLYYTEERLTAN